MNSVHLIGRLTSDPHMRATAEGSRVAVLRLAVAKARKDEHPHAVFVNIVCFGRQAELAEEHLRKGRRVVIEGRLDQREWTATDGEPRSRHEIVARHIEFLDAPIRESASPESRD